MNKFLKYSAIATVMFVLTACYGIQKIEYYAYTHGKSDAPTVVDYQKANVNGVNESNIEEINEIIASKAMYQVDTDEEIQEIVDEVNNNGGGNGNSDVLELLSSAKVNKPGLKNAIAIKVSNSDSNQYITVSDNGTLNSTAEMPFNTQSLYILDTSNNEAKLKDKLKSEKYYHNNNFVGSSFVSKFYVTSKDHIFYGYGSSRIGQHRRPDNYIKVLGKDFKRDYFLTLRYPESKYADSVNYIYANDNKKVFFSETMHHNDNYVCRNFYVIKKDNTANKYYWFNFNNFKDKNVLLELCQDNYTKSELTSAAISVNNNFYQSENSGRFITYDLTKDEIEEGNTIQFGDKVNSIKVSKDQKTLYLAVGKEGVVVLDISNPNNPVEISTLDTQGYAYDISLSKDGKKAYVADGKNGIVVIDVSNPRTLKRVGKYSTNQGTAYGVNVTRDNKVIVANGKEVLLLKIK